MRSTSVESYCAIRDSGVLSELRWDVYDYIYAHGPLTARQTIVGLSETYELSSVYSPRFAELKRLGLIADIGTTECEFSGRNVTVWDVTANMPIIKTKAEALKDKIDALEKKLIQLKTELLGFE